MLGENIKRLRKEKGITQEELAIRLHVVRQTISKWEKNLSVPDAEMLVSLAEQLDTSVETLLGADIPKEADRNELAEQLSRINEQMAIRNRRSKRIWTTVAVVLAVLVIVNVVLIVAGITNYRAGKHMTVRTVTISSDAPEISEEEVQAAMDIVGSYFRKNFKGCELKELSYDEEFSKSQEDSWKEQYDAEEVIVLLSDFETDSHGGDGSLEANSIYEDWQWILTRAKRGKWTLQTWGYA